MQFTPLAIEAGNGIGQNAVRIAKLVAIAALALEAEAPNGVIAIGCDRKNKRLHFLRIPMKIAMRNLRTRLYGIVGSRQRWILKTQASDGDRRRTFSCVPMSLPRDTRFDAVREQLTCGHGLELVCVIRDDLKIT